MKSKYANNMQLMVYYTENYEIWNRHIYINRPLSMYASCVCLGNSATRSQNCFVCLSPRMSHGQRSKYASVRRHACEWDITGRARVGERESIAYGKPVDASERAGDKLRASRERWIGLLAWLMTTWVYRLPVLGLIINLLDANLCGCGAQQRDATDTYCEYSHRTG